MVQKCIDAIKVCSLETGEVDLIDIRTLNPIDWEAITLSVKKTGKLLIVHEDLRTGESAQKFLLKFLMNYLKI